MKKHFLAALAVLATSLTAAQAQSPINKLQFDEAEPAAAKAQSPAQAATDQTVTLTKVLAAYYDAKSLANPEYYLVLTDDENASYDVANAKITVTGGHLISVDLFNEATSPIALPAGEYTGATTNAVGTYDSQYSKSAIYDESGKQTSAKAVSGTVSVTKSGDIYTIKGKDASGVSFTYTGELSFIDANAGSHVYDQITSNVNTTFTGGLAYYYGNLYESQTGNIYINLYDCDFDSETGGMNADGYDLALCAFGRLFPVSSAAHVEEGIYSMAQNFSKGTYYPGMEVDYMGNTIPFGSYIKQRKGGNYYYGYVTSGQFMITENEDGTYDVTVNLTTDAGLSVRGTASHISFTVIDVSDDEEKSHLSNLEDDVHLDLSYVPTAYAWRNGYDYDGKQTNGCNVYTIDISRPSGKDMETQDPEKVCDLMRFELITKGEFEDFPTGTYTMMDESHLYTNLYEPYKLVQGYFYNGGELTGTRYFGFYGAPTGYIKWHAPAESGTVSITKDESGNYTFNVDLVDDAGWSITGTWTGPVEKQYTYDPTAVEVVENNTQSGPLTVYTADGRYVGTFRDLGDFNNADANRGMYIIKGENQKTYKAVRK